MKLPDKIIIIGVVLLILGTVLAIGAVHPWSYSIAEAMIFGLVAVALAKVWRMKLDLAKLRHSHAFFLVVPLALFVGLVLFQLLPLPPLVERVISPTTYEIYSRAFPGWPLHSAGTGVLNLGPSPGWLPLSIAPSLTETMLLKVVAYSGFFLLVLLYPLGANSGGERAEERFYRTIFVAIVASATLIAAVGLVEVATWNGKILWLFTPYAFRHGAPDHLTRLIGPFVNPDHFANYLVLAFPLALSGTLFESFLAPKGRGAGFGIFCGVASLIIAAGIFGSLSRAGWFGALLGLLVLVVICMKGHRAASLLFGKSLSPRLVMACLGSLLLLLLFSSMFLVGSSRTNQADLRLTETTFGEASPGARFALWQDSVGMVRDFPLFGVGLGCWPEFYPHYRRPPWLNQFAPATHDDYLQLLTETGAIGFLLLAWFFGATVTKLYQGLKTQRSSRLPMYAALLAALSTMAVHEIFDFNLQTPANALLFVLILGLALRMGGAGKVQWATAKQWSWAGLALSSSLWALSAVLIFLSLAQDKGLYPYNVTRPTSLAEAHTLLRSHPANSRAHLWTAELLRQAGDDRSSPGSLQQELRTAIWLEPTNPFARDRYLIVLFKNHYPALGLAEISRSVFVAPWLAYHAYLASERSTSLPPPMQKAVEDGIKAAVRMNFEGSVASLALFYDGLGRFAEEGDLLENANSDSVGTDLSPEQCLILAGSAYSKAKDLDKTERVLHRAVQLDPTNTQAYQSMIILVFAPKHDLRSAKDMLHTAIENGADPYTLYVALSEAADANRDTVTAEAALSKAAELRPDFQTFEALGLHFLNDNNLDRATFYLKKASEMNPKSAQAAFYLGVAEQSNYQYTSAERDYARAVALDPKNASYRTTFESFKRKVADNMSKGQP